MAAVLTVVGSIAGLVVATPAYSDDDLIELAGDALTENRLYVDPDADDVLSSDEQEAIETRLETTRTPIFVAVLPDEALNEVGGNPGRLLAELQEAAGRPGTYVIIVEEVFAASSTVFGREATALADRVTAFESSPVGRVRTFVDQIELELGRADPARTAAEPSGSGGIPGPLLLLGLAVLAFGWMPLVWRHSRRQAVDDLTEVRRAVGEDIASLAAACSTVDKALRTAPVNPPARTALAQARDAAELARRAAERVGEPEHVRDVTRALEEGWYALAAAHAHLKGEPPPERRPPCLFDPRHGPAATYVDWAPSGIDVRSVPACRADAIRMSEGRSPQVRRVRYGGERRPYWDADRAFVHWTEGWYAAESTATLYTYLWGTPLGEVWDDPSVTTAESPLDGWREPALRR